MTSVVAGASPAKCVRHNRADLLKEEGSYQVSHQVSYQGIASAMPQSSQADAPSGAAHGRNIDRLRSHFGMRVPSKMRHHALNWAVLRPPPPPDSGRYLVPTGITSVIWASFGVFSVI